MKINLTQRTIIHGFLLHDQANALYEITLKDVERKKGKGKAARAAEKTT